MANLEIHEHDELPVDVQPVANKPDVTKVQWAALIAVAVQFARAFGIWDASPEQEQALQDASLLLGGLVLGDAGLRIGRNLANR